MRIGYLIKAILISGSLITIPVRAGTVTPPERLTLPAVPAPFSGELEPTENESSTYVPTRLKAPDDAPNVILVMTDDVGFSASSTFGGPIPTPNLDQLASEGLRYNRFHTTGICSPTRAALLTGRNHHSVGVGMLADLGSPYPGYTSRIPHSAATIARVLRDNGYNTAMFGKDHNVPSADRSPAGPFDQWPTGRGFEYFYGFVAGDTNQWEPALFTNTNPVASSHRPKDLLLDKDLADHAIRWIHNQKAAAPNKPFFIYYAPGTAHAPLQAPKEWIARFRGKFDQGWDKMREQILARQKAQGLVPPDTQLAKRPEQIPAWDSLSATEKKVYTRYMEVFAAVLAYQDAQFGRIMHELKRMGIDDNTLVFFIEGDNGSSAEGGPEGTLNELAHLSTKEGELHLDADWLAKNLDLLGSRATYQGPPAGWSFATDTPFPWTKQIASHLGGVRNGLVVAWPGHIKKGNQVRAQYHHVIDIMPTILEATGIPAPTTVDGVAQQPIEGTSMVYSFNDGNAPDRHTTQYYEIMGNRGIYKDGWLANTTPRNMPWEIAQNRKGSDTSTYQWELYNLNKDFSQSHNLAASNPEKLKQMQAAFDEEARRYQVYPIHDSGGMARGMKLFLAPGSDSKMVTRTTLWGPDIQLSMMAAPPIFMYPFSVEAGITVPEGGGEGVILAAGSHFGGWSFYLDKGVPVAYSALSPLPGGYSRVAAEQALAPGKHHISYNVEYDDLVANVSIKVDGKKVASGTTTRRPGIMAGGGETVDSGRDSNTAVSPDYQNEGVFTGEIQRIDVEVHLPLLQKAAMKLMGISN